MKRLCEECGQEFSSKSRAIRCSDCKLEGVRDVLTQMKVNHEKYRTGSGYYERDPFS